jgi:hypothetical protein
MTGMRYLYPRSNFQTRVLLKPCQILLFLLYKHMKSDFLFIFIYSVFENDKTHVHAVCFGFEIYIYNSPPCIRPHLLQ